MTDLVDDRMDERMDQRLSTAARRWQAQQPAPVEVPLDRLGPSLPRRPGRLAVLAAAAVLVVGVGTLGLVRATGGGSATPSGRPTGAPSVHPHREVGQVVPWRALKAGHPSLGHRVRGHLVTPYDKITASGTIDGIVRPDEELEFEVTLKSPSQVSLHPCPDYTIIFGRASSVTRQLNCAQVPYYASVPLANGGMSDFRPTLPPQTPVTFEMHVRVPYVHGQQKVIWALDGAQTSPGFYGVVRVVPGWEISGVPRSPRALAGRTAGQPAPAHRPG